MEYDFLKTQVQYDPFHLKIKEGGDSLVFSHFSHFLFSTAASSQFCCHPYLHPIVFPKWLMVRGTKVAKQPCNIHRKLTLRKLFHWYNIKPWTCTLPWCFITSLSFSEHSLSHILKQVIDDGELAFI